MVVSAPEGAGSRRATASRPSACSAPSPSSPSRPSTSPSRCPTSSTSPRARAWSSTTTRPTSRCSARAAAPRVRPSSSTARPAASAPRRSRSPRASARARSRVVSSDEKERVAREAGADEVVRSDGAWKDEAKELSGGGVDVVLDPVGGDRFTDSLRSLGEGGRLRRRRLHRRLDPRGQGQPAAAQQHRGRRRRLGRLRDAKPDVVREIGAEIGRLADAGFVRPIVGARFPLGGGGRGAEADRRARRHRQGRAGAAVAGGGWADAASKSGTDPT